MAGKPDFSGRPLLLAPMEDVTDIGFRRLCKRYGAAMVYTEFVAAEALVRSVKATVRKLQVSDDERPVGIQIYGRTTEAVVEAAKIVEAEAHPDIIDLNFGCPVKKVAGKGAGAGMLMNLPLMLEMTEAVVKAVSAPVTVKTRLGWDTGHIVMGDQPNHPQLDRSKEGLPTVSLAERLQDCGISALTIHGRTRAQMYTGEADWTPIGETARNPRIHIPVIGNGDITSAEEADRAFDEYGVAAVMIGRATFGQPWIFSRPGVGEQAPKTAAGKVAVLKELLRINLDYIGDEYRAVLHTRRHLADAPVFKGIPDFRPMRIRMLRANRVTELEDILDEITDKISKD